MTLVEKKCQLIFHIEDERIVFNDFTARIEDTNLSAEKMMQIYHDLIKKYKEFNKDTDKLYEYFMNTYYNDLYRYRG